MELLSELRPETGRYAMVLDDFHLITNSEISKSRPMILRRLPHTFTVFLLSRGEIPPELQPFVRDKKKNVIRREDLRFTEAENPWQKYLNKLGHFLTPTADKVCVYGDRRMGYRRQLPLRCPERLQRGKWGAGLRPLL